jgi:hypothetical protein
MATKKTEASKPTKPRKAATKPKPKAKAKPKTPRKKAATVPKMEDVAKAKGKQEFVKVARTKNKKKPRTWVIVYKLMTGPDVDVKRSRKGKPATKER